MRSVLRGLALLPVLVPQALWVKYRAARLCEAPGPRAGVMGQGPRLRVLVVGDSSAAGVGADTQEVALAGRLAAHLAERYTVSWVLNARCGATTTSLLARLRDMPADRFDVAVIALGVNDSKNGMTRARWRRNYAALIALLRHRFGVTSIIASGLPPLGEFPILPAPLRHILGARAQAFDADLREIARAQGDMQIVSLQFEMDASLMASDGFHPGPVIYDRWAARVAGVIG